MKRNTIQREMVLDAVTSLKNHASADEVYEYIIKDHPSIGRGTVYRNLNDLSESGDILKINIPNGADRFDHNTYEHYHARCTKCDKVFDVEMDVLPDLCKNIHDTHGFIFLKYEILFSGICDKCK